MSDLINEIDDILKNCFNVGDRVEKAFNNCKAEIERLSKPYVPMTDDEFKQLAEEWMSIPMDYRKNWCEYVETAVIARYNGQRGVK